ncbi:MAG: hypothetical protein P4L51_23500 [Puia sp.]|nr:hypothetical protein [Puia sp.]
MKIKKAMFRKKKGFYMMPAHLKNKELVQLFRLCFSEQFEITPQKQRGKVSLTCRQNEENPIALEFFFTVQTATSFRCYPGVVEGYKDVVKISRGLLTSSKHLAVADDWGDEFNVSDLLLKTYMEFVGFFKPMEKSPETNPVFKGGGWQEIYFYTY